MTLSCSFEDKLGHGGNYFGIRLPIPLFHPDAPLPVPQTASVGVAVALNRFIQSRPALSKGIIGRFVPLMAIAAANCVNIPLMRQSELKDGITVSTADGEEIGASKAAAISAVAQVGKFGLFVTYGNLDL